MKKQIAIIGTEDEIKTATDILTRNYKKYIPNGEIKTFAGCPIKTNFIPETFADVKQFTKELIEKIKLNKDVWEINIQEHFIDIQKMYVTYRVRFTDIGNILFDSYLKIAENKTAAEMWAIIKSLIGEK